MPLEAAYQDITEVITPLQFRAVTSAGRAA